MIVSQLGQGVIVKIAKLRYRDKGFMQTSSQLQLDIQI